MWTFALRDAVLRTASRDERLFRFFLPATETAMAGRSVHTRESLIEAARTAAADAGTARLSVNRFKRATGIADSSVYRHFENWAAFCGAAGLAEVGRAPQIADAAVFAAMHAAFLDAGRVTGKLAFVRRAGFGHNVVHRRFGGWAGALAAFAEWQRENAPDFPYADELAGRIARGRGTGAQARPAPLAWPSGGGRACGAPMGWRALLHAPVNEQGVVLCFGMLAETLGFAVEGVGIAFPDCLAKRRVAGDRWEAVRIEFEFRSRSFRDHAHDPAGCDLIVCWEHDWADCPVEVLALSDAVQRLREGA
jgi:hypothetical protein